MSTKFNQNQRPLSREPCRRRDRRSAPIGTGLAGQIEGRKVLRRRDEAFWLLLALKAVALYVNRSPPLSHKIYSVKTQEMVIVLFLFSTQTHRPCVELWVKETERSASVSG